MKISLPLSRLLMVLCVPVVLFVAACNKGSDSNDALVPSVATNPVLYNLKDTSVNVSYMITNYVVGTITGYGVCWSSTNQKPTTADSKKEISTSASNVVFVGHAGGLTAGTTYYIRAYGVTGTGTIYGNVITFKTNSASTAVYGTTSTFAGSGASGLNNGTGAAATFNSPQGVAFDKNGNLYVADTYNSTIRMITSAGVVTTLAGNGVAGFTDGTGTNAQFYSPIGLTVDGNGNIYVADAGNNAIRKITPAGVVTTLAGGKVGFTDATGTAAKFNTPTGIAIDGSGNLFVTDRSNHVVRKVTSAGVVTTFAGAGVAGYIDSTTTNARFNRPNGIAIDGSGNLLVADAGNNSLRKINSTGTVTTIIGNPIALTDALNSPVAVASDLKGRTFITDATGQILEIASNGFLYSIAGNANTNGFVNGAGTAAKFDSPQGLAVDANGNVFVADNNNNVIRKLVLTFNP